MATVKDTVLIIHESVCEINDFYKIQFLIEDNGEHLAELPVLYSRFPLAIYFTHVSVFMSDLLNSSYPPLPALYTHVHSLSLRFYSCPTNRFICTIFSRFHIYALNRELSSVLCDDLDGWDGGGGRSKREGIYVYI